MAHRFAKAGRSRAFTGVEFSLNGKDCEGKGLDSVLQVLLNVSLDETCVLGTVTTVRLNHNKKDKRMSCIRLTRECIGKVWTEWSLDMPIVGLPTITLYFKVRSCRH